MQERRNSVLTHWSYLFLALTHQHVFWFQYQKDWCNNTVHSLYNTDNLLQKCWKYSWIHKKDMKIYLHFRSFLNNKTSQDIEFHSWGSQEYPHCTQSILCCWWPGDTQSQVISSYDTDLFILEYSSVSTRGVNWLTLTFLFFFFFFLLFF